ncbi:helix-turn-helix domain-containing protein, partial [Bordetella avium]
LPLDLAIDAIENAAPMGQDWPVNWPLVLHGLKELRSALASAPNADECRHVDTSETSAEPVAWMDPETKDVITQHRKFEWERFFGEGGKRKAESYTVELTYAAPPAADERANVGKVLPEWEQVSAKLECGETLTPLEVFVHDNEPAGEDADAWRDQLSAALASAHAADAREEFFSRFANPLTPYGYLARALRVATGTTLLQMAMDTGSTPPEISAIELGRKEPEENWFERAALFFASKGFVISPQALQKAHDQSAIAAPQGKGSEFTRKSKAVADSEAKL